MPPLQPSTEPSRHRVPAGRALVVLALVLPLAAGACGLLGAAGIERPSVSLDSTRLQSISVRDVDLLLGFEIDNPNALGVRLEGFDYRLSVAGTPLAEGDRREELTVPAGGRSRADLPLSVAWDDLAAIYRSVRSGGETGYRLDAGFTFEVPVLGPVRIPLTRQGDFPVVRLPRLSVRSVDVRRVTAGGAELALDLEIDNPNDFPFTLRELDYALELAGSRVLSTRDARAVSVARGGSEHWELPLSIDFGEAGRAVAQALSSGGRIDYRLTGTADLTAPVEWLEDTRIPIDASGRVDLR